jgi:lipid-A-disaccharide synthase
MTSHCIMLVAAEASGDVLGSALAGALRARLGPNTRFIGVGGPRMASAGIISPVDIKVLGVLGIFDALRAYPAVLRLASLTADLAAREGPEAAILIDSWGFNLRVARGIRARSPGTKLIKYVAPQVWATRPGRARTLARVVDSLLTIHSFDADYFEKEGLPVTFVGNPALERDLKGADAALVLDALGAAKGDPILLLLPGSRRGEVDRLLPHFREAVQRLKSEWPNLHIIAAPADSVIDRVRDHLSSWHTPVRIFEGDQQKLSSMRAATVALACSGTVTTELASAGCAMVIAYRLGPFTAAIARRLVRTRFITLFNVAAQRLVAPELVQEDCNGAALAREVSLRLADTALRDRQVADQTAALDIMRGDIEDPIGAAADAIIANLNAGSSRADYPRSSIGGYSRRSGPV